MDINLRKPRIINLKKKRIATQPRVLNEIPIKTPIKVHTDNPVSAPPEQIGNYSCIECGAQAFKELGRCVACETNHQKIVAQLDAKPKQVIEKVPEKWVYYKQVQNGVVVTVRMTEQEALLLGKKIE